MNVELKPCPFCGGKAEVRESPNSRSEEGESFYEVRCKICGVHVNGASFNFLVVEYNREKPQDLLSAVERWNKRACEKNGRKTGKWIPVSERLPENLIPVNITWVNHNPAPYYAGIKDKPFTATGVYFNGQWYWWSTLCTDMLAEYCHNYDDIIDDDIEIIAWQPLPEPYKEVDE